MSTAILRDLGPTCRDITRRALIVGNPGLGLNGIDFVEYRENAAAPRHVLEVHFLQPLPAGAFGLPATLGAIRVDGGTRIVNIRPLAAVPDGARPRVLNIEVDRQGDFSTYVLSLGWQRQPDGSWRFELPGVDRQFSVAPVGFRAGCPVDFDCLQIEDCPPDIQPEPLLDYLARDYASFRQLLLDLVAQRHPRWLERNPADLGIALLELFAHEGDHLSYFQDAVANEAYLDAARMRVSAKRHARLVDYAMHDGRNAWAFVHVRVTADGLMPPGQLVVTRVDLPLRNQLAPPPAAIPAAMRLDFDTDPALAQARAFETATTLRGRVANNEIRLHTWGNDRCCLPRGTTTAHVYAVRGGVAERPDLRVGDYLLLEEVRGPETGAPADADPTHRQVVRIRHVRDDVDRVYSDRLSAFGALQTRVPAFTVAASVPVPAIAGVAPASALAGGPAFTLTLDGGPFVVGSEVRWDGAARPTTVVSASRLTADIGAADIAAPGAASITVVNPGPGGGTSAALSFALTTNAVPAIVSMAPASALAGGPAFTLIVNGTGFAPGAEVRWDGAPRPTAFVSSAELTAAIGAADIAAPAMPAVTVVNPAPGGGASAAVSFAVTAVNPAPAIVVLAPTSIIAASPAFTVTVTGRDFVPGAEVRWNGTARPTAVASSTELTAAISAADVAAPGVASVTVVNPGPGGGVSTARSFDVLPIPVPDLESVSPPLVAAGSPAFTLTVRGTGFVPGSEVRWNGAPRPTALVSPTELTAAVGGADVAAPGTVSVIVVNPAPGGGQSGGLSFLALANPVPEITAIAPVAAAAGGAGFTLRVRGAGFVPASVVRWNGVALPTTFASAGLLTAAVGAVDIAAPGAAAITVWSPVPDGGPSAPFVFDITAANPVPTVTGLAPASAVAGTPSFDLTVRGTGFVAGSQAQWGGAARLTTVISATELIAAITAADVAAPVGVVVTVVSPGPGGGVSGGGPFTVDNPVPVVTEFAPSAAPAGGPAFTLTVRGSGFLAGSEVRWDGSARPTTFVSATELTADIAAADVATAGRASVTVFNPPPGGGLSGAPLPVLEVTWRSADALAFPLCLSAILPDGTAVDAVSVARGNVALADHGRTIREEIVLETPPPAGRPFRIRLADGPLTMHSLPASLSPDCVRYDFQTGRVTSERGELDGDVRHARPAVSLVVDRPGGAPERWTPVPDLLASGEFDRHFVADVERDGRATLRFGDSEYGREVGDATRIVAWYRVGNGNDGNVGPGALAHLVLPAIVPATWPAIEAVRNPLAAGGGVDPESIEEVRQYAPAAFRARQFRAVTATDYRDAALTIAGVAGAVAGFRWTGSWHTVFVAIDPRDEDDLITEGGGRTRLAPAFEGRVRAGLSRYRLAGYDLEIRAARYVPLRIELELCVRSGYFRGDVAHAVAERLTGRHARGGRPSFFDPASFTFGQPVYLSSLYADVEAVEGVDSLTVTVFQRFGRDPAGELASGVLRVGLWEIARLDNDPNRMENGVLVITARGGK
jgi:predicted phage baseplate assembly protein